MRPVNFPTDPQDQQDARFISQDEIEAKRQEVLWDRMNDLDMTMDAISPGEWGDLQSERWELAVAYLRNKDYLEAGRLVNEILVSMLIPTEQEAEYRIRYEDTL